MLYTGLAMELNGVQWSCEWSQWSSEWSQWILVFWALFAQPLNSIGSIANPDFGYKIRVFSYFLQAIRCATTYTGFTVFFLSWCLFRSQRKKVKKKFALENVKKGVSTAMFLLMCFDLQIGVTFVGYCT